MEKHPIAQRIIELLEENSCWFETFEHEPVRTSEEAAALRPGYSREQGTKAIIARIKVPNIGKSFIMLTMPSSKKFNTEKVKRVTGSKDIRFASDDEVERITNGVPPGGIPPFGNLFDLKLYSDAAIYNNENIIFNAGRTSSIAMKSADYASLSQAQVADIIEQ